MKKGYPREKDKKDKKRKQNKKRTPINISMDRGGCPFLLFFCYPSRGRRKKLKSLEPRRTRRPLRKRKALLSALRVLRVSLLFRGFCDSLSQGCRKKRKSPEPQRAQRPQRKSSSLCSLCALWFPSFQGLLRHSLPAVPVQYASWAGTGCGFLRVRGQLNPVRARFWLQLVNEAFGYFPQFVFPGVEC